MSVNAPNMITKNGLIVITLDYIALDNPRNVVVAYIDADGQEQYDILPRERLIPYKKSTSDNTLDTF